MIIGEIVAVALRALAANKLRSLLTMLGIVIGVAAVIAMLALGTGARRAIETRIASLGTTRLTVNPTRVVRGGIEQGVEVLDDQGDRGHSSQPLDLRSLR